MFQFCHWRHIKFGLVIHSKMLTWQSPLFLYNPKTAFYLSEWRYFEWTSLFLSTQWVKLESLCLWGQIVTGKLRKRLKLHCIRMANRCRNSHLSSDDGKLSSRSTPRLRGWFGLQKWKLGLSLSFFRFGTFSLFRTLNSTWSLYFDLWRQLNHISILCFLTLFLYKGAVSHCLFGKFQENLKEPFVLKIYAVIYQDLPFQRLL